MPRQYKDTETRRRQVAEAALRTIAEDGVDGFTTRALAARVGVTDGTLFRHFKNKVEIVLAAIDLLGAEIDAGLASQVDPRVDIEHFFRHRAAFVGGEGSVGRLIFSEGLQHLAGEAGRDRIRHWKIKSMRYLDERLQLLHDRGALAPALDPGAAAMLLQGVLLTFAMSAAMGESPAATTLPARIDAAWYTLCSVLFT